MQYELQRLIDNLCQPLVSTEGSKQQKFTQQSLACMRRKDPVIVQCSRVCSWQLCGGSGLV